VAFPQPRIYCCSSVSRHNPRLTACARETYTTSNSGPDRDDPGSSGNSSMTDTCDSLFGGVDLAHSEATGSIGQCLVTSIVARTKVEMFQAAARWDDVASEGCARE
jgi:hypothetical protein